jgi:hypothetical protein
MSTLSFRFHEAHDIRVVMVDDAPWFVASDVAALLEYRNAPDMTRMLDEDEKDTQIVRTLGGGQEMTVISESGLYSAVLRSRKPEARQFRKWVTAEVLPAIRKTGRYEVQAAPAPRKMGAPTEFLALPFVDVNSPFRFWCLPLEGDYFAGYEKGRSMALAYLAFLSNNTSRKPDSSYVALILESFMKRFQFINGAAFVDAPIDHGPMDFHILKGHYCGFFGTLGHAAWLTARSPALAQLH